MEVTEENIGGLEKGLLAIRNNIGQVMMEVTRKSDLSVLIEALREVSKLQKHVVDTAVIKEAAERLEVLQEVELTVEKAKHLLDTWDTEGWTAEGPMVKTSVGIEKALTVLITLLSLKGSRG